MVACIAMVYVHTYVVALVSLFHCLVLSTDVPCLQCICLSGVGTTEDNFCMIPVDHVA